jgi:hypothetical protein
LIGNCVGKVKGEAKQEKGVLVEVTNARMRFEAATTVPDKKSNQNSLRLQDELAGTENQIL